MPLTLQTLINNGLLKELAKCFNNEWEADYLLNAIGYDPGIRPSFQRAANSLAYWQMVCEQIEKGSFDDGFEPMLEAAGKHLPGNPKFAPFAAPSLAGATYIKKLGTAKNVFLSFNSKDRVIVTQIAQQLEGCGVHPWLDEADLTPGRSLRKEIEEILSEIKAVAIFYSQNGVGPWQDAEIDIAVDQHLSRQCLLIPVMLPGVAPVSLPPFLRRLRGIRFTDPIILQNTDAMEKLAQAIRERVFER